MGLMKQRQGVLITRREAFVRALGPDAEDLMEVNDQANWELSRRISKALATKRITGRLALFAVTSRFQHGSPFDFETTGGILKPSIPLMADHEGRLFPHGPQGVCAAIDDVETVVRRALLNSAQPALANARERFGVVYWRRKDQLGRVWHFTTKAALQALQEADATGTAYTWGDTHYPPTGKYVDPYSGVAYDEVRFPHAVKVQQEDCFTLNVNDLTMDPQSLQERPTDDLFVIDAAPEVATSFVDKVGEAAKFLDVVDKMEVSIQPLSASYFPREQHMYS